MNANRKLIVYLLIAAIALLAFIGLIFSPIASEFFALRRGYSQNRSNWKERLGQEKKIEEMLSTTKNLRIKIESMSQRLVADDTTLELIKTLERIGEKSAVGLKITTRECQAPGICFTIITTSNWVKFLVFLGNLERMAFFNSIEKLDIKYQKRENNYQGNIDIKVYTLSDV